MDKCLVKDCNKPVRSNENVCDMHRKEIDSETIKCPFCSEKDFDLRGLKGHLEHGDCEPYEEIDILSLRLRMFIK